LAHKPDAAERGFGPVAALGADALHRAVDRQLAGLRGDVVENVPVDRLERVEFDAVFHILRLDHRDIRRVFAGGNVVGFRSGGLFGVRRQRGFRIAGFRIAVFRLENSVGQRRLSDPRRLPEGDRFGFHLGVGVLDGPHRRNASRATMGSPNDGPRRRQSGVKRRHNKIPGYQ
jgi:hypothetical protein